MHKKKVFDEAGKTAYEIMVILPDDLGEAAFAEQVETVKALITERDGEITHEDKWGLRDFTYRIKKYDTGYYFVLNFKLPGTKLSDLNKNLRLNTTILRFLIVATAPEHQVVNFEQDKEKLGLDILPKDLLDVDRPHKKRKDKFGPDKKTGRTPSGPPKIKATTPEVKEVKKEVKKEEEKTQSVVTDEETKETKKKPVAKEVEKEKEKEDEKKGKDNTEDRLAALDEKLEKLLSEDL